MIRTIASGFAASKPLPWSVETLSHRFLQRCSVSGTPKGKGKAGAAPLKKSKITNKKSAAPKASGGTSMSPAQAELEKISIACLNAPSPLRHLTRKQREREDERARLGLFSEEALREQKMLKKKAGEGGDKGEEDAREPMGGPPGLDFISLGLVDADKIPKYELTVEDGRRLAKEYSRFLMKKLRRRQAAESNLLKLKKAAIEALPEHLKAAAMVPDMTPFPPSRGMVGLTPPIEGYQEKAREAARQLSSRQTRK